MAPRFKREVLSKILANGVLGIAVEVLAVAFAVLASFLVCAAWWGVF